MGAEEQAMHTLRFMDDTGKWTVGSFNPDGTFYRIAEFDKAEHAEAYASYLNGGRKPV